MKKSVLIFLIFASLCLSGCDSIINDKQIIFGDEIQQEAQKIYEFGDGVTIYSKFLTIDYKDSSTKLISLSKAFKTKKITIDEILSKKSRIDYANDSGSILYTFFADDNDISDRDFYIVECKKDAKGNKKMIFGNESLVANGCSLY